MESSLAQLAVREAFRISGPRTGGEDRVPYPDHFKNADEILYSQLVDMYHLFPDDYKEIIIRDCEETGLKRQSVQYVEIFADKILSTAKYDPYGGEQNLKQFITKDLTKWFAYNHKTNQKYRIIRSIAIQGDQNVYLMDNGYVMKWEEYTERNAEDETYELLENKGMQAPEIMHDIKFFGFGVLMIEFLYPLDVTDRPIEVARQLLQQLSVIHTIGCYFDLKPDNIRKKNQPGGSVKYYIIDMNLSTEMLEPGIFKRKHYTYYYASQTMPFNNRPAQRSSAKNDFIELMYVLHQMIAKRLYLAKKDIFDPKKQSRHNLFHWHGIDWEEGDLLADPETMIKDPIATTSRGLKNIRRLLEWPLTSERLTQEYAIIVERLEHGFPPTNIYYVLAETLSKLSEERFFEETKDVETTLNCQVCNKVTSAYRCGGCYNTTTFLCDQKCAVKHVCN